MPDNFTFSPSHFNRIFPFYILFDYEMSVLSNGSSLKKIIPDIIGKSFSENFRIIRPNISEPNFQSILSLQNQLVLLQCNNEAKTSLRGQIDYLPNSKQFLFLGNPWFESVEDIMQYNLSLHDFSFHDATMDMLHVKKTHENTNDDLNKILQMLNQQKDELKKANKEIHDIALFPTQNPDPMMRINFEGDLMQNNPAAARLDFIEFERKLYRNDDFFKLISQKIDKTQKRWHIEASSDNTDYSFACITMQDEGYINIYGRDITQQKKDQQELEKLSLIIQQTINAVIITNSNGEIEWVNTAFEKITGYKLAEVLGKRPGTFLQGKETDQDAVEYMKAQIRKAEPFTCEILNYKKSGDSYWLRINGQPIFDKNKNVTNFFAIEEDITKEKEVEEKVKESASLLSAQRTFYEQILDNIPSDIAVFDANHTYLYLNPKAISNPELRKWIVGKRDEDYIKYRNLPAKMLQKRRITFNQVVKSKQLHSFEEELKQPDGSSRFILRNLFPVINDKGGIELVIGYGLDITSIKNIQSQIEASEKKYRDVINNSLAIVTTHDIEGKFLTANPMVSKIFGYTDKEIIGKSLEEFIPHYDKAFFHDNYLSKILKDKEASGIFRVVNLKGETLYILYNNFLKEEENKEPYVIAFAVDITDRIKAEHELKIAKNLMEELAKTKQNFIANMSHEIRTPMNAIMGMAKQLSKTDLNGEQQFFLHTIQSAIDSLLIIINDILDISKIEAGKLTIEKIGFEPKLVVGKAMQVLLHKAEEKGLAFTNSYCDSKLANVLIGDPHRLNQVLLNLISNAIKFTEKGRVDIRCEVIKETATEQVIKATVTDTGIGMEAQFAKNIFEKFRQEDESITRRFGGTGLGMSICKNIVELMHGNIEVISKKGEGTSVSFTIPFAKGSEQHLPSRIAETVNTEIFKDKKILITDDNEMNRLVASTILKNYGAEIEEAQNGAEAIEKIQEQIFDLVLMDVQMPVMDGIEATQKIRETLKDQIPVIALTAFAVKGDSEKFIAAGMNDYLSKPFEENQFLSVLAKWLDKKYLLSTLKYVPVKKMQLYDLSKLEAIAKGNQIFTKKMITLFMEQSVSSVTEIKAAYVANDFASVKKIAHRLKPSIDSLNIESLRDLIRDIERNAETYKSSIQLKQLISSLETVIIEVNNDLEKQIKK